MLSVFHLFYLLALVFNLSGSSTVSANDKSVTTVADPVREEDAERIPWLANRKLTWDDFQSTPVAASETVALTSTSLGLNYKVLNNSIQYQVTCYFTKYKSWATMKTDYILAHEQGHFDITELYARKLHQELQAYVYNSRTYKKDISEIYRNVVQEKEALQMAYDRQTDHSRNRRVQAEWQERIDQMLLDSDFYAAYP
ncbi:MAG: DUF922 domain-containing protein [Flavisolibacter sp.]